MVNDNCLVTALRAEAQNDYMIDQNYLPTGSLLLKAADRIEKLEAENDQLRAVYNVCTEENNQLLDKLSVATRENVEALKDENTETP